MTFDWGDYLDLAQELAGIASTPASLESKRRSAISRAYYSLFCSARNYLITEEGFISTKSASEHWEVREKFRIPSNHLKMSIFTGLQRLWIDRKDADYEDIFNDLEKQTLADIKQAKKILSNLKILKTFPPRVP